MLALLPDNYKPDFILQCLFLRCFPAETRSHFLQEKISDPRALALKADELFQSRNLLADLPNNSAQVNTVVSCADLACWQKDPLLQLQLYSSFGSPRPLIPKVLCVKMFLGLPRTLGSGQGCVSTANRARSRPMFVFLFLGFLFLGEGSPMFTWIWLVSFLPAKVSVISSQ